MGRKKIDWIAEQEHYVAGDESFTEIAARLHISKNAVEQQSRSGGGWARLRREFRTKAAGRAAVKTLDTYADKIARVKNTAADVAEKALNKLAVRLNSKDVKTSDLIATAKLATAIRVELTGADGKPVQFEIDDIRKATDEELRAIAHGPE